MRLLEYMHKRPYFTVVLAVGFVARLFALWMAVAEHGATWLYTRGMEVGFVAESLLSGHGFASPFGVATGPTALIAPGFPLLVAGLFKIFGVNSSSAAVIIMLAQVAVNLATIALIMHLAERLASTRAALISGVFWAIWPPLLWMPTIFWETSLSAFMLIGMVILALYIADKPSGKLWIAFGFLSSIAVLINMALLISLGAMFMLLAARNFSSQKRGIGFAALVFLLVFSAWPIRNARTFHAFIPLRTTVGLELWMGNHDGASGYVEEAMFPMSNKTELQKYKQLGEVAYDREKSKTARSWIATHPAGFAKLSIIRIFRFWTGSGSRNGSLIFFVGALFTSAFGIWGFIQLFRRASRSTALLIATPLLLFPLPYYLTHAEFRYRLVIDPILTVLTGYILTIRSDSARLKVEAPGKSIDLGQEHLVA